ncbi:ABC1 kinase family protein [Pseudotabrizicola algicola]|uniref:AarF/ABC1/UbiB kinase family protein n=1 Tax=Pseudotabrizicola algicola TaxID=2709381 RepID=A0A6B3RQD1_9RHOB|nr:AarF/ABC1/UbiB kinase family protein [Pseudotabrizicola algicola]NEX47701.1 AarF/ABC1/UbiB kinase family protein [Pseudotabrizicola algicola]
MHPPDFPEDDSTAAAVPTGRAARLWHFGGMAGGIAGSVATGGLRALAGGQRPRLSHLLLTPSNTQRLTDGLSHLRGAALKLGQMLSLDTGVILPPELTAILSRLRDDARHMPPKQVQTVLNGEWGPGWYGRFARFDVRPFAAASIGQVHRAVTRDGTELAIKVQYPGVRDSIDSDIDNVATLLRLPGLLPRGMDLTPLLAEAKRQLHAEADYSAEARHLSHFGERLAGSEDFLLPALHAPLSTPRVLAMTYVQSDPLDSLADAPQALRDRVAAALIDLVLRELFVLGAMQTDPNLANYRFDPKTRRVVLLDFGAVQSISPDLAADFRALAQAALDGGPEATQAAMLRIGYFAPDTAPHHQALIRSMFDTAMAPLRQSTPFDFAASDLLDRLHRMGRAIGDERDLAHVPPAATLFLHRKIGGMYLMATKLRARVALRPMVERYCLPA